MFETEIFILFAQTICNIKVSNFLSFFSLYRESAYLFISVKPVARSEMHAGNCIAWNTVSFLMVHQILTIKRKLEIRQFLSSQKWKNQDVKFPELCTLIWSQLSLVSLVAKHQKKGFWTNYK